MTDETTPRVRMPRQLKIVLAVLIFQILANSFVGYVVLAEVQDAESHGQDVEGAGLVYFASVLSFVAAALLLLCVVMTFQRLAWVRPTVITIQVVNIVSGLIALLSSGQVTALTGIVLSIAVISVMSKDDVRDWYQR
jgi:hypothetical protein